MRTHLLIGFLIAVLTVAVYGQMLGFQFNNADDLDYVVENAHVRAGLNPGNLLWALTTFDASNWHPLTWLSHMADVSLYGMNPMGHHLTNLLLHLANALLLFLLLLRTTGASWRSGFVALVFALHPLHVESVAWVAERKDVLSTFLLLLTLITWTRHAQSPVRGRYGLSLALFALGLTAKPMLVTAPLLMLLLDRWPLRRPMGWSLIREKLPFFALSAASCAVTILAQMRGGSVSSLASIPLPLRVVNALVAYAKYLALAAWPRHLAVFYPHPGSALPAGQIGLSVVALILVSAFAWVLRGRAPYVAVGWAWYLLTLVPVIGLVQVGMQAMADRYTYVPLIGIFILVAWGVPDALGRVFSVRAQRAVAASAAGLCIAALVPCARVQVGTWKDSITLFGHAVKVTSGNAMAYLNLGNAFSAAGRLEEAIGSYQAALKIDPGELSARTNLAIALSRSGRFAEAVEQLSVVVKARPDDYRMQEQMGLALRSTGRLREAAEHYRESLRINPDQPQVANNLAWMLATSPDPGLRSPAEAVRLAEMANRGAGQGNRRSMLDTMAAAYACAGRFDEAIAAAETALRLAEEAGDRTSAAGTRSRLALYRNRRPYVAGSPAK